MHEYKQICPNPAVINRRYQVESYINTYGPCITPYGARIGFVCIGNT